MKIYETWPVENDPDNGPNSSTASNGMWSWWRTGLHPMGRWQSVNVSVDFNKKYSDMKKEFPIMQDKALGPPSDFGGCVCHSCEYSSSGYPEPNHKTVCDGICKRSGCEYHGVGLKHRSIKDLEIAISHAAWAGISKEEILQMVANDRFMKEGNQ